MSVRVFTIPFDVQREIFQDEDFTRFLLNKRVKRLQPEFFQANSKAYWTVFVEYETVVVQENASDKDHLDDAQSLFMKRFRQWRKEKAEKEGIPVFIIATNKQLVDVIRHAPVSLESLRSIHGFGKKKIERYGKEIVEIVKAFYEKKPLRQGVSKNDSDQGKEISSGGDGKDN